MLICLTFQLEEEYSYYALIIQHYAIRLTFRRLNEHLHHAYDYDLVSCTASIQLRQPSVFTVSHIVRLKFAARSIVAIRLNFSQLGSSLPQFTTFAPKKTRVDISSSLSFFRAGKNIRQDNLNRVDEIGMTSK